MNKLGIFDAWKNKESGFAAPNSAQGYLQPVMAAAGSCGSSCGAGDKEEKPSKPSACGSSCGAGDKEEKPSKPSACGSSCGAGGKK
ncbi:ACGX-repeat peptide [Treponema sp. OttesenSCG-928-L16]|nr:ACGX-repeat peptide [Treponema sp. OttesenSCG-928-L16]